MKEAFPVDTALVNDWDAHGINGVPSYDFGHSCVDMEALLFGFAGYPDQNC